MGKKKERKKKATHHLVALPSMTNSNGIMGNNPVKRFCSL
jgi:hypothetical protein